MNTAIKWRTAACPEVIVGKSYHWKIVRNGGKISWFVDDMKTPFLELEDSSPLRGPNHAYFGFNNWRSSVSFDNLEIAPLPQPN